MLSCFADLRDLTIGAIALRMLLAVFCGGLIGLERAYKGRPAGFRTHIIICLGAALTPMTSQFLFQHMNYYTDISRLGSQVIAGIGFIGAGSILVTKNQRVKGLTTAAGLWAAAIIGLVLGSGFYEAGIIATILILIAEIVFGQLEYRYLTAKSDTNIYIEYTSSQVVEKIISYCQKMNIRLLNFEITKNLTPESKAEAILSLAVARDKNPQTIVNFLHKLDNVVYVKKL